jgi:2-oxoglutarate dehydrogenase complex dehydrogenase (E1) component-like enzyme
MNLQVKFSSDSEDSAGDVKYHLGASSDREFDGNSVHVSLTDNPSHLEAVNPVVLGQTRAKQFFHKDKERNKVIPILIHGDAAFAGQGVVAECFAMSGLPGHNTGGTIHIIVNNQIGLLLVQDLPDLHHIHQMLQKWLKLQFFMLMEMIQKQLFMRLELQQNLD